MLALVDGDIVTYRIGFTTEDTDHQIACWRAHDLMQTLIRNVDATEVRVFLTEESDPNAFRKKVYPEYKAHRVKPRPKWYKELRDFLMVEYNAEVIKELEADDAMAIAQMESKVDSVICSIDKDLKQIPGNHFDFVKGEWVEVEYFQGLKHFYKQLLMGDSSDNIKGIYKMGPKKAESALASATTEEEMFDICRSLYGNDEEMLMNGRVLWIWRNWDDDWRNHYNALKSEDEGRESC